MKGFSLFELIIIIVVLSIVFATLSNSSVSLFGNNSVQKNVQEHVDKTVNEIEYMRNQSLEYQKRLNDDMSF